MLRVVRYPVNHPVLSNLIKYFWVLDSESSISISHNLLPVNNIDIILPLSSPIEYITNTKYKISSSNFHFNGIRDKYYTINQTGKLQVYGVSFFPIGLFPLLRTPLSEFRGKTIELDDVISNFTEKVTHRISAGHTNTEIINIIENTIAEVVNISLIPNKNVYELTKDFSTCNSCIGDFCEHYGLTERTLERLFHKYIGVSPKLFQRIHRFNKIVNQLKKTEYNNLTQLAYDNNYFDQSHFINDFKSFICTTPAEFINQKLSIKQIMELL